jgi:hypothetical protein
MKKAILLTFVVTTIPAFNLPLIAAPAAKLRAQAMELIGPLPETMPGSDFDTLTDKERGGRN